MKVSNILSSGGRQGSGSGFHRSRIAAGTAAAGRVVAASVLWFALGAGGCVKSMTPGDMARVQTLSDQPRAGNVYLLRGWIGIFSYGIDGIGREINEAGVRASVYQDDQWYTLAQTIKAKYKGATNPEPLILVGHSYGADDVINVSRELEAEKIPVDLVVTLDPVTPRDVPGNVKWCYNLYQPGALDMLPFMRGIPLKPQENYPGKLQNVNIRKDRTDLLEPGTDHFNIEKKAKIHGEILAQVLKVCPTRQEWVTAHGGRTPTAPWPPTAAQATARAGTVNAGSNSSPLARPIGTSTPAPSRPAPSRPAAPSARQTSAKSDYTPF